MKLGEDNVGQKGYFMTFEGTDGAGKSTQLKAAQEVLEALGYQTLTLREPGGTPLGEAIRKLVLDPAYTDTAAETELMLMCAARAQLVQTVIQPALEKGVAVICDRFADSTIAYQGYGRGLDLQAVQQVLQVATAGIRPDRTILLDADPQQIVTRRKAEQDRIEAEALTFQTSVREGFRAIAEQEPERIRVLDANRNVDDLQAEIANIIKEDLEDEIDLRDRTRRG